MSIIKGNPELDFKEQNPIMCSVGSFKKLYETNPLEASKLLWSMYMIEEETTDNPLSRLPKEDRIKEVQKTYHKVPVDSELYKIIAADYTRYILTKEETLFAIHIRKFEEMTSFLDTLSLTDDKQFEKYYKIMDKLDKMWKGLEFIKQNLIESKNKNHIRGNAQLSVREKRGKK